MTFLPSTIARAEARVIAAREIADQLRCNDRLHRLSMDTVFVLEDVLFELRRMAERDGDGRLPKQPAAPLS